MPLSLNLYHIADDNHLKENIKMKLKLVEENKLNIIKIMKT
jgi:hypothetical protein